MAFLNETKLAYYTEKLWTQILAKLSGFASTDYVDEAIATIPVPEITVDSTITTGGTNPVNSQAVINYVEESILGGEW